MLFGGIILNACVGSIDDIGTDTDAGLANSTINTISHEGALIEEKAVASELIFTRNLHEVSLVNNVTGAVAKTYHFENHDFVYNVFDFGYILVAVVGTQSATILTIRDLITFEEMLTMELEEDKGDELLLYLFDSELNVLATKPITNKHLQDALLWDAHDLVGKAGELFVYYSPFRHETGEAFASIRRYHVQTGETEIIASTSLLGVQNLLILADNLAMITSYQLISDTNSALTYGLVDLLTGEERFNVMDYYRGGQVRRANQDILIPLAADTSSNFIDEDADYSEVLIFNLLEHESRTVKLGPSSHLWARLAPDGATIITVTNDLSHFRKYDSSDGTLLFEIALEDVGDASLVEIFPLAMGQYATHLITTDATAGLLHWQMMGSLVREVRIINVEGQ